MAIVIDWDAVNVAPVEEEEDNSKSLMYKYLYNGDMDEDAIKKAEAYMNELVDVENVDKEEFNALGKRIIRDVATELSEEILEVTIDHGIAKRIMPTDFSKGVSHNAEIKEGTCTVGTFYEFLHINYVKPIEGLNISSVIVGTGPAKVDFEVPAAVDIESYDVNGLYTKGTPSAPVNNFIDDISIMSALGFYAKDWFEAECVHSDCDGYYDVDGDSCYCPGGKPPCSVCENGDLVCTSCGEEPPETVSDVDGMWDAIKDICRG